MENIKAFLWPLKIIPLCFRNKFQKLYTVPVDLFCGGGLNEIIYMKQIFTRLGTQ